jgi:hypothetical protein
MLRGNIDFVSRTRVEGWVHSDLAPLVGQRLLAFVDNDCVGAGMIELFREDLVQAGIGDGMAGFSFPIHLKPAHDARLVDIRLDGGNFLLRQADSCLMLRGAFGTEQRRAPPDPETLAWMRNHGWLTQEQFETLDIVGRFGVCRAPLREASPDVPPTRAEIGSTVLPMLELNQRRRLGLAVVENIWGDRLPQLKESLLTEFPASPPLVALWSPQTQCLNVIEGSHWGRYGDDIASGVDYEFGADTLLWINLDANLHVPTGGLTAPLVAFLPRSMDVP